MQNSEIIDIKGLCKSFNSNEVLKGIDLNLQRKENLVILGKSGTGKSVLIKCLVRLIEPDKGEMNVLGHNIRKLQSDELTEYRRKIGFLFQGGALYDSMTVKENLIFPLKHSPNSLNRREMEKKAYETLQSVKLETALNLVPLELSGGMKKRVALARTLMLQPEIVLYDEPTTGLDAVTTKEISNLIVDLRENYGVSSIIITHDMTCARITSNRVNMLRDGRVIDEGSYEELQDSKDPWIHSFFK